MGMKVVYVAREFLCTVAVWDHRKKELITMSKSRLVERSMTISTQSHVAALREVIETDLEFVRLISIKQVREKTKQ